MATPLSRVDACSGSPKTPAAGQRRFRSGTLSQDRAELAAALETIIETGDKPAPRALPALAELVVRAAAHAQLDQPPWRWPKR